MTERPSKLPVPEGYLLARDNTGKYLVLVQSELKYKSHVTYWVQLNAGPFSKRFDAVQWVYRKQAKDKFSE